MAIYCWIFRKCGESKSLAAELSTIDDEVRDLCHQIEKRLG